ncbi:MAG: GerMN domain-containing protein [Selenomonadaceae bacterium]|nr:GerMN domain-containing protein [Selenomonadaceae bacterium]
MKKFFVSATLALVILVSGCQQQPQGELPAAPEKPAQVAQDVQVKPLNPPPLKPVPPVESEKQSSPSPTQTLPAQSMRVKVYYPDDSGMRLVEVERKINVEHEGEKYFAAVEILLDEPYEENLTTIFPRNANIRSVTVEGGLATVDLDGSIVKNMVGGSTGEEFLVGSIVDTLTNFPEVTQVKFLVDGKEIETLSGHMDLSTPLERMDDLIQ